MMGIVNYNNDVGEYWEWSDQGFLAVDPSNEAYKLGHQLPDLRTHPLTQGARVTATSSPPELDRLDDAQLADRLHAAAGRITGELRKVIVGQENVVEQALIALFAGGNCLLIGVPGLAKTLLVHTLSRALDLKFSRIQFTPDLMPSDVTGTDVIQDDPETGQRKLAFMAGPDLRERAARRRNQPHATQDAVRPARGDAGAPRDGAGTHVRTAAAVLRVRDAEPHRTRGHLSAAGGAARPLHARGRARLFARGG